jgi:hypothetical protein
MRSADITSSAAATFSSRCATLRRSRDREQYRRSVEQPGKADLSGRRAKTRSHISERACPGREPSDSEWRPRQKSDGVFLAAAKQRICPAVNKVVQVCTLTTSTTVRARSSCSIETSERPTNRIKPSA